MAQPIRTFDVQSWSARSHSSDCASPAISPRRDVQVFGNPSAGIMSAVLHLLVEHICQEPRDAKRLFRYIKRKLKKYLECGDQQIHPNYDKPQTILLKNELNRVISETASQAKIAIHHDRIFRTEISLLNNPAPPNFSKYYVPDIRESANFCQKNFICVEEIGRGGFGSVCRMRNKVDNIEYAVKMIELEEVTVDGKNQDTAANNEKIRTEVLILATLDHPNIVRYHSTWTQHRVIVRSSCCHLPDLQRTLSLQPSACLDNKQANFLSDGCGDCTTAAEQLVIEEVRGASGGSPRGQLMVPALAKSARLTSQDFARPPSQSMWSSQWSDTGEEEEEDEKEENEEKEDERKDDMEKDRKRTPSGETKHSSIGEKSQLNSATMKLVRHGQFNVSTATTTATSTSIVRSHSVESKAAIPVCSDHEEQVCPHVEEVLQTTLYIQMQLCDLSLKDWLSDRASLPPPIGVDRDQCMHLFEQAVRGVAYLHNRNLIHRDIKPANILLVKRSDGDMLVKLADFGLSRYVPTAEEGVAEDSQLSEMSSKIGTLFYAAPEQRSGCQYGREADMYSFGLILFELFRPCGSESELVAATEGLRGSPVCCPPDFLNSFPDVATLVCQLLHKDPQKRLTAHDLLREGSIMGKEWMRQRILDLSQEVNDLNARLKSKDDRISFLEGLLRARSV